LSGEVLTLPLEITGTRNVEWSSFEQVFHLHGARMKSIAYNLLGNEADAEDALQEAFLKGYRSQQGFKKNAALHTWVYRILINNCLDEGYRRQRRPFVDAPPEAVPGGSSADLRFALRQAMSQLAARPRAVFLMAAVEGLPHAGIAAILEISETNSRTLLLEARRELQVKLSR